MEQLPPDSPEPIPVQLPRNGPKTHPCSFALGNNFHGFLTECVLGSIFPDLLQPQFSSLGGEVVGVAKSNTLSLFAFESSFGLDGVEHTLPLLYLNIDGKGQPVSGGEVAALDIFTEFFLDPEQFVNIERKPIKFGGYESGVVLLTV